MIDLAIGTPEVGVVDFNMLQTVLHCLAQQMRIVYKNVELRGSLVTDLPNNTRNVQTVAINEFLVTTQDQTASSPADSRPGVTFKEAGLYRPAPHEESILVVERVKKTDSPIALPSPPHVMPGAPGSYNRPGVKGTYRSPGPQGSYYPAIAQGSRLPGAEGSLGPPGSQGTYVPPGADGSYGPSGAQHSYRPPEEQDFYRPPGEQGSYGLPGTQGPYGPPGAQGSYGPSGAQGSYGPPGEQGSYGPPGAQVPHGLLDAQGSIGPPGAQGSYGPPEEQGPRGAQGAQGTPGTQDQPGYGASDSLYPFGPGGAPDKIEPVETGTQDSMAPGFYGPPGAPGYGAADTKGRTEIPGAKEPGFYGPPGRLPNSTAARQEGANGLPEALVTMGPAHYVAPPRRLSVVTLSKFNLLENIVVDLRKRVYGSIPNNEEILEEVRSQSNLKSITDMWTSLNVSARLEAAEIAQVKLGSLVQELIKDVDNLKRQASQLSTRESDKFSEKVARGGRGKSSTAALPSVEGAVSQSGGGVRTAPTYDSTGASHPYQSSYGNTAQDTMAPSTAPGSTPQYEDLVEIYDNLNRMQCDIDQVVNTLYSAMDDIGIALPYESAESNKAGDEVNDGTGAGSQVGTKYGDAQSSIRGDNTREAQQEGADEASQDATQGVVKTPSGTLIEGQTQADARGKPSGVGERREVALQSPMKRLLTTAPGAGRPGDFQVINKKNDFERQLNDGLNDMGIRYDYLVDQIKLLRDKVEMIKNVPCTGTDSIMSDKLSPDLVKDLKGLMQLFKTVQEMQTELANVHATALNLVAEKEDRQHHIDALLEQIEVLKNCKMDRDDIAEVMAEKADMRSLARKVSHDQFEIACDDLARGLEQTIGKLNQQEALWQQALDDIQREIESKLDKMELSPMRDFFNNKLKQLQENLKQMAMLRREAEAAGTKRRLLRDVNCISCDAKAVMAMDPPITLPTSKPLSANMSMKPYLSYELDAIRKSQATSVPQRNMHDWEVIDKSMAHPKTLHKARSETDKHLCNRYCGGAHTTTTPTQRVARLGHFVKQWGPDVMPLSSGLAAGDDGKIYKVIETGNIAPGMPVPGRRAENGSPRRMFLDF